MPTILGMTNEKNQSQTQVARPTEESKKHVSSSTTMGKNQRLDTISKRNKHAAIEMETLLWRALCDSPEAAKEYLAHDCVMINPLFAGTDEALAANTDPSISQVLDRCGRAWNGYRFKEEPLVVEVGLMAIALVYRLTLYRQGKKGVREVQATACSSWRQTAGADWLLCAQHVAYSDDDEEDEEDGGNE